MADTLTDTGLEPVPSPEFDYHALMVEEGYYEGGVLERYSPEFVKAAFKAAYAHRFRFETFLGAFKYYTSYTLKVRGGVIGRCSKS